MTLNSHYHILWDNDDDGDDGDGCNDYDDYDSDEIMLPFIMLVVTIFYCRCFLKFSIIGIISNGIGPFDAHFVWSLLRFCIMNTIVSSVTSTSSINDRFITMFLVHVVVSCTTVF